MNRYESRLVRTDHPQSPGEVFRVPIWLGAASIIGLISALLGDDIWDVLSWITILAPVAAVAWAWRRRAR
ncbi:hypothetical protein [Bordetella petrii]|uniref:hypothetical protein n=1 Tax=Bordetella petrii TaxID=94624 RepID=UPI001E47A7B2|nr:hypothetical protein [Bordetella petrii]MCD0502201.1 hypothetical protein [Bordetella petrii]